MERRSDNMYYTGTVVEVLDKVLYEIKVDIPGIIQEVKAFPMRGEIDEPKVGDFVLLRSFDPVFQSYYLYQKIKENDFIGFRSNGKFIDITPEYIQVAIFDPELEYTDTKNKNYRPEPTDWIKLDKDGNLDVYLRKDSNIVIKGENNIEISGNSIIKISGDSSIKTSGNSKVEISGNSDINVSGNTTLTSPKVKITGGTLEVSGQASNDLQGPFNCIPVCPFSGAPHRGKLVSGT